MTAQETKYLRLAQNAATPPDKLREIFEVWKRQDLWTNAIEEALAQNPNTPVDLLLGALARSCASDVGQNPIWILLPLENPAWLRQLDDQEFWQFTRILHRAEDLRELGDAAILQHAYCLEFWEPAASDAKAIYDLQTGERIFVTLC